MLAHSKPVAFRRSRALIIPNPDQRPVNNQVERSVGMELPYPQHGVRIHPRVNRVLKFMAEKLGDSDGLSLRALAGLAGLSPSRFMHVFTQSMGMPLRSYILRLRLRRACCELMTGATVTSAAYSAGFSDAAHLTRTFRRMLGMTPTTFILQCRSFFSGVSTVSWIEYRRGKINLICSPRSTRLSGPSDVSGYEQYWLVILANPKGILPFTGKIASKGEIA
jgi:AraC-like DNA-binding protein